MKIGIDVSQLAYPKTGVANYLGNLVKHLVQSDQKNEYILFASSFRRKEILQNFFLEISAKNVTFKLFSYPPSFLDLLWNRLHIMPIEKFLGDLDIFISSDWTQPPSKAKKVTILYDLIVFAYPQETAKKIVDVQKRKLSWVKKEIDNVICISQATKKDAENILHIPKEKLSVVYPGL